MKDEPQLELNFDDPVELALPPSYLRVVTHSGPDSSRAAAVRVEIRVTGGAEIRVTIEHAPADPETGKGDK